MTHALGTTLQDIEAKAKRKREALVACDYLDVHQPIRIKGNCQKCKETIRKYIEES